MSSISTTAKGFYVVKSMQTETGIHQEFYSIGSEIKQPVREADNNQRLSPKAKDEPSVTALTLRIAVVVSDSCAFTFC